VNDSTTGRCCSEPKFSAKERARINIHRFYAISRDRILPTTSFSSATFRSTRSSSAVVNWGCGGCPPTRSRRSSARASTHRHAWQSEPPTLEQIEHGPSHLSRLLGSTPLSNSTRMFATFLRNGDLLEQLADLRFEEGLAILGEVRGSSSASLSASTTFQARCMNAHVDFPLLQRLALPITVGSAKSLLASRSHDARHDSPHASAAACPAPRSADGAPSNSTRLR